MRRRVALGALLSAPVLLPLWAPAAQAETAAELTGLTLRGQARFRFYGFTVYDIRLWSAEAVAAERWADTRLTLELEYLRGFSGKDIAQRSLQEMQRQAPISDAQSAAWLAAMQSAFPDVKTGDRLSGQHEPGVAASFYVNGQLRQRIPDAAFAKLFFGIWLSPKTSEPTLRQQLLGGHAPGA